MLISKSRYLSLFNVFFFLTKYFIIFGKDADQGHRGLPRTKDHILYHLKRAQYDPFCYLYHTTRVFCRTQNVEWQCSQYANGGGDNNLALFSNLLRTMPFCILRSAKYPCPLPEELKCEQLRRILVDRESWNGRQRLDKGLLKAAQQYCPIFGCSGFLQNENFPWICYFRSNCE